MLYRLEVENFYSIRDRQVLDLEVPRTTPDVPGRFAPLWRGSEARAPKVMALFGANASGKTNVLRALAFLAWFLKSSFNQEPSGMLPLCRFWDEGAATRPVRFALHFSGPDLGEGVALADSPRCRYIYEVAFDGTPFSVLLETLRYQPVGSRRAAVRLLHRGQSSEVTANTAFGLPAGEQRLLKRVLRPNASAIATLAQMQHPLSGWLLEKAQHITCNVLLERDERTIEASAELYSSAPTILAALNREIRRFDLGIKQMLVQQTASGPSLEFVHEGVAKPLPAFLESHGTRAFVRLFPYLVYALEVGGIAGLDEFDAAIHSVILPDIVRWFHDPVRNPHDAQLWITCHDASLLDHLEKEEVFFCDKDPAGRTEVYGLRDIQSVRRHDSFSRRYLGGVYGAVPLVG